MSAKTIHRHEVPVDGQMHTLTLSGAVLHVATRRHDVVEMWALETGGPQVDRTFTVVGTGHPWPQPTPFAWQHVGTAVAPGGQLVWHLLEVSA